MSRPGDQIPKEVLLEQPFVAHLLELRDRLLRAVIAVALVFLVLFPFANDIYLFVARPLMEQLPAGASMIATEVASPFLTPFKLTLMVSVFLAVPFILYQVWAFVAPGLYQNEKRMVMPLVVSSTILYYLGMAFAYYVVFPLVYAFLIGTTPDGITVATDIAKYLDFVLTLFFAFGIAFEVPIATILLVWMGVTTPASLREKRPYVVVAAFVIGMFLTPPDVISQTLLALPMWVLFEAGLFFSRFFVRGKAADEETDDADSSDPASGRQGLVAGASGGDSASAAPHDPSPRPSAPPVATQDTQATDGEPQHRDHFSSDPEDPSISREGDESRYRPLTPEELEAELDIAEADELALEKASASSDANRVDSTGSETQDEAVQGSAESSIQTMEELETAADPAVTHTRPSIEDRLRRVQEMRDRQDLRGARELLYQILVEGDESEREVARNILTQLDE